MDLFMAVNQVLAGAAELRLAVRSQKEQGQFHPDKSDKAGVRLAIETLREVHWQMVEASGGTRRRGPRLAKTGEPGKAGKPQQGTGRSA